MPKESSLPNTKDRAPVVSARHLDFYFGEGESRKQVLYDNNLDLFPGEIAILTGPSGSGKTTFLTLVGALRSVQEGSLRVLGRDLKDLNAEEVVRARRDIGFIFQAHNLFDSLSAYQNVKVSLALKNFKEVEMRSLATRILRQLGLEDRIDYRPQSLSGGQRQRVAIARALVTQPRLILADEPTAALDKDSTRKVVRLLQEIASEHQGAVLLVTHDNRILESADRIINMVDGRIVSDVLAKRSLEICEFLANLELFERLDAATMAEVAEKMGEEVEASGVEIFHEGSPGEKFYLIQEGSVEVRVGEGSQSKQLATLGPGDIFGEMALLTDQPRNATIRTLAETRLYTLGKKDFQEAVEGSPPLKERLLKVFFQRQAGR